MQKFYLSPFSSSYVLVAAILNQLISSPQYSMTVQNQSSSGHVGPNIIMDTYKWIMVDLRFEIQ
jgi:hypothetical protein